MIKLNAEISNINWHLRKYSYSGLACHVDTQEVIEFLTLLGIPQELISPIKQHLNQPIADIKRLQAWQKAEGIKLPYSLYCSESLPVKGGDLGATS